MWPWRRPRRVREPPVSIPERFVRDLGSSVIVNPKVSASRNLDVARVEVSGQARNVVPGLRLPIRQASQGPIERFRGADE